MGQQPATGTKLDSPLKIAVYGLGHLGFPLASTLAVAQHHVIGIDPVLFDGIEKASYDNLQFERTPQPSDVSFIVVPTPSMIDGSFDSKYVRIAIDQINEVNDDEPPITVIVSTVSPGTCEELRFRCHGGLVYNPTFIALDDVVDGLVNPDLLLIGTSSAEAALVVQRIWTDVFRAYNTGEHPTHYASFTEVELLKLSLNAALGTKISLANSLGKLFEAYGVPASSVQILGFDHRIGQDYLRPGPMITGPCLPRDNRALQAAGRYKNITLPISVATDQVNQSMARDLLSTVRTENPQSVGILGMAYKYGLDVDTDAVGPWLAAQLIRTGTEVRCFDPILEFDHLDDVLKCDLLVIVHREFDDLFDAADRKVIRVWS